MQHTYRSFYEEKDGIVNKGSSSARTPLAAPLTPPKSASSRTGSTSSSSTQAMDRRLRFPPFSPLNAFPRSTFFDDDFALARPYWADTTMFSGHRVGDGVGDIVDNEVEFKFTIDVSQFEPEELKVNIVDNDLIIEAKHEERTDKYGAVSRQFMRKFHLPTTVKPEEVKSELSRDGHLTVRFEKERPTGNVKKIPIQIQKH